MAYTDEQIIQAAQALRPELHLPTLRQALGGAALELDQKLEQLLAEVDARGAVADAIRELLYDHEAARQWMVAFLGPEEDHDVEKASAAGPQEVESDGTADTHADAPRWLNAEVFDLSIPNRRELLLQAFRARSLHALDVWIGPEEGALVAKGGPAFDQLFEPGQSYDLTIVLLIPSVGERQSRTLRLPPQGSSEKLTFQFEVGEEPGVLEASILAYHGNRPIQATILKGFILADPAAASGGYRISFAISPIWPGFSDLDRRQPFDAGLVTGHDPEGVQTTTGVVGDRTAWFDDAGLNRIAETLRKRLTELANDLLRSSRKYSAGLKAPASSGLLRDLAVDGSDVYAKLAGGLYQGSDDHEPERFQLLLSDPNDFLPLEFVYDFPVPAPDATLCPNWERALESGQCPPKKPPDGSEGMVLGGLSTWVLGNAQNHRSSSAGPPT